MPKRSDIKKVLVIGSGPIVIGQAAEFDYAGTQACRSLKEEGVEVCLVNSNPATIMTDKQIADQVYIEPLTVDVLKQIILKEKPDSVLPTLGGQAGLNLGMELEESGFLAAHNVKLLGTTAATIRNAEGRQEFKDLMERIGEPCAASRVVENVEDGVEFTNTIGYPVVLRPAYTLGGSGGGIAHNQVELEEILENGLRLSRVGQVLVERCIAGWKEIEYEVMRDSAGNCITVCNMENIDPVGACVGARGARGGAGVEELQGEKMDIVVWSEDICQFVASALSPADVISVTQLQQGAKACRVIVPDDQLSLAIGKEGQNARLAARLTGCKIDIKPASQAEALEEAAAEKISGTAHHSVTSFS